MSAVSGNEKQMPQYDCHKKAWALKIKEVKCESLLSNPPVDKVTLIFEDSHFTPFVVDNDYARKHLEYPQKHLSKAGGYYVVYEDGYKSYSPEKAFVEGYKLTEHGQPVKKALLIPEMLPVLEEAEFVLRLLDSGMEVAHGRSIDAGKKLLELITKIKSQ